MEESIFILKSILLDLVACNSYIDKEYLALSELKEDIPFSLNRDIYNSFCCMNTSDYCTDLYTRYRKREKVIYEEVEEFEFLSNRVYSIIISLDVEDHGLIFIIIKYYVHVLNTYGGNPTLYYTILTFEKFDEYK